MPPDVEQWLKERAEKAAQLEANLKSFGVSDEALRWLVPFMEKYL